MDIQKCILNNGLGLSTLLFSIFQGFSETTAAATTRQARNADHGFSQALFSKAWILRSVSWYITCLNCTGLKSWYISWDQPVDMRWCVVTVLNCVWFIWRRCWRRRDSYVTDWRQRNQVFTSGKNKKFFLGYESHPAYHSVFLLLLLLLLLRWHYSPMQTFASLMDCPQSTLFFWPIFPVFNFASVNICLYAVPPSVFFGRPLSRLPWGLLLNTRLTFLLLYILSTWPIPIQPTYSDKWKYI